MSAFTIKNFSEIDDSAAGRMPGMEMRFARGAIESEHVGVTLMKSDPNLRSPIAHSHREQEEVYVVVAGSGNALLDGQIHALKTWDVLRVSSTVVRAFESGPHGMTIVAIGSDRPEGGDGVMGEAAWPAD